MSETLRMAIFKCARCGKEIKISYYGEKLPRPKRCLPLNKGGCGRKTTAFELIKYNHSEENVAPAIHASHSNTLKRLKELYEAAKQGNILFKILQAIESKHVGETETALTALLYILNAIGGKGGMLKIEGSSSAGKTNLANTIINCLPPQWVYKVGEFSQSALKYIDWKKYPDVKIIYIQEAGGAGEKTVENIKLMSIDDGGFKAVVTKGNPSSGFTTEEIDIPVKFILTTSAKNWMDPELENRMFVISIDESNEQTRRVVFRKAMEWAGDHEPMDFSHIHEFMRLLKPFDKIIVPFSYVFAKLIGDKTLKARRDIDKILSLIAMSAFLNQKQRPQMEKDGKRILFATPEDAYNIFILSFDAFEDTLTGMSKRLREVYRLIPDTEEGITYREIAKKVKKTKRAVENIVEKLENLNLVEVERPGKGVANKVRRVDVLTTIDRHFENYKMDILLCALCKLYDYEIKWEIPRTYCEPTTNAVRNFYTLDDLKFRGCSRFCGGYFAVDFENFTPVVKEKVYIIETTTTKMDEGHTDIAKNAEDDHKSMPPNSREVVEQLLSLIPHKPSTITVDEIMKNLGFVEYEPNYDEHKEYLIEKLKELYNRGVRFTDEKLSTLTKINGGEP